MSCENPADQTADAEVGPALNKTVDAGPDGSTKWTFTENSYIEFTGSKVSGGTQVGRFTNISGYFTIKDGEPVGNDHKVEIDMNSITTEKENSLPPQERGLLRCPLTPGLQLRCNINYKNRRGPV